ncbi:hypothetical protein [Pandoraea sputorum]|uniref:hypothetical protein n=1 Tax=Pandoraea sputorum TaxID=93222 RepID=UPI0012409F1F|nr:hypothetical protein [Pandoraea sputorum]VVE43763.1 hypothetical protein PSP20601_04284 [Pandoraea sputorum]
MTKRKDNVVIEMLHAFVMASACTKAAEIIADAQRHNCEERDRENWTNVDEITKSANEFLDEIKKIPHTSCDTEIITYRGKKFYI